MRQCTGRDCRACSATIRSIPVHATPSFAVLHDGLLLTATLLQRQTLAPLVQSEHAQSAHCDATGGPTASACSVCPPRARVLLVSTHCSVRAQRRRRVWAAVAPVHGLCAAHKACSRVLQVYYMVLSVRISSLCLCLDYNNLMYETAQPQAHAIAPLAIPSPASMLHPLHSRHGNSQSPVAINHVPWPSLPLAPPACEIAAVWLIDLILVASHRLAPCHCRGARRRAPVGCRVYIHNRAPRRAGHTAGHTAAACMAAALHHAQHAPCMRP